ncbi:hypothetical protein AB0L74_30880 [Streptomyces sp. NPDC052020]|uniref:hypothetical protein n=1 Tax=Streptomyces sp. NPDC052020 TaxID=3155677 RepID=UPI0034171C72
MATFWGEGDDGVQQPLTDEMVREAERVLGGTLPSALLGLLRVQNGGAVTADHHAFPTSRPPGAAAGVTRRSRTGRRTAQA